MRLLLFILFSLLSNIVLSQLVVIDYIKTDDSDFYNSESYCQLLIGKNGSLFTTNYNQIIFSSIYFDENENLRGETENVKKEIFKDFDKKHIISPAEISFIGSELIIDSLNLFSWEIIDEEKEILGYKCKGAKTSFRGRDYVAFFSETIGISDGPWKFNGLPGLILEVVEKNNRISFKADRVEFPEINNPTLKGISSNKAMTYSKAIQEASIDYNLKNEQINLRYNSNIHSDFSNNIEVYNLNPNDDRDFIIDYEVFVEFESLDQNNKILEKTIPSTFQLYVHNFKSNYIYKEKLENEQSNNRSFGYISSAGDFYKDYVKQVYLEDKRIGGKPFLVSDSLKVLNWKIDRSNTKIILGYICTRATLMVGKYNIEAWYTSDIFSTSGPDKYGYLPGLILELKEEFKNNNLTETKYYKAYNIVSSSNLDVLPRKTKLKPISLQEYENQYEGYLEKMKSMYNDGVDTSD